LSFLSVAGDAERLDIANPIATPTAIPIASHAPPDPSATATAAPIPVPSATPNPICMDGFFMSPQLLWWGR